MICKLDFDLSDIANVATNIVNPEKDTLNYLASNVTKWTNEKFFLKKGEELKTRMKFQDDIIIIKAIHDGERYMESNYDFEHRKWIIKIVFEEGYEKTLTNAMAANIFTNLARYVFKLYNVPYVEIGAFDRGLKALGVKYVMDNVENLDLLPFLKELEMEDDYEIFEELRDIMKETSYELLMNIFHAV